MRGRSAFVVVGAGALSVVASLTVLGSAGSAGESDPTEPEANTEMSDQAANTEMSDQAALSPGDDLVAAIRQAGSPVEGWVLLHSSGVTSISAGVGPANGPEMRENLPATSQSELPGWIEKESARSAAEAPVVEGVSGTGFIYGPPGADVASLSTGVIIEVYSGHTASATAIRDLMVGDVELYESGSDQILVRPVGGSDVDFAAFLARLGLPKRER